MVLATFVLVFVTSGYVFLTHRLVRIQQQGIKREIVERIFPELLAAANAVVHGQRPSIMSQKWQDLCKQHAFLIFHSLFPATLHRQLRAWSNTADQLSAHYDQLSQAVAKLANESCAPTLRSPTRDAVPAVNRVTFPPLVLASLAPEATVASVLIMYRFTGPDVRHEWIPTPEGSAPQIKSREWLQDRLADICGQVHADATLAGAVKAYSRGLSRVERIHRRVQNELQRAGRV